MKLSTIITLDSIKKASVQKKLFCFGAFSLQSLALVEALYKEGYINGFSIEMLKTKGIEKKKVLKIELKYKDGNSVFTALHGISKPSKNIYIAAKEIKNSTSSLVIQQTGLSNVETSQKPYFFQNVKEQEERGKKNKRQQLILTSNIEANRTVGGLLLGAIL